jgi:hypothetical protein
VFPQFKREAKCIGIGGWFGPGVIWKDIWKEIAYSMNDPVLPDFDWRTVHRILPVNSRMHQWNSWLPSRCARCRAQVETLEHVLVDCPKIKICGCSY